MVEKINSYVWGNGLIILLLMTGLLYTLRLHFIQFRILPYFIKIFQKRENKCSQFGTFCMSLGTAMGTGNITGVASAIRIGGAGAIFWMWISAFLGMALVYAENCLSAKYSTETIRGPIAYIRYGLGSTTLSGIFAFFCLCASFGMGGMAQISTLSENLYKCVEIRPILLSCFVCIILYVIIKGGTERISGVAKILLPLATFVYTLICVATIIKNKQKLPFTFLDIFSEAFGLKQAMGGITGYSVAKAVSVGIRRGIFSNEAGLGSSPLLHSASENYSSYKIQGMCSMLEVFIDTILCCTLTAAAVLCSSVDMTVNSSFLPVTGAITDIILALLMVIFAFCTVIGWSYCGSVAFCYLFGSNSKGFNIIFSLVAASGAFLHSQTVWTISDIFNGLMAFPNIIALLLLVKHVSKE